MSQEQFARRVEAAIRGGTVSSGKRGTSGPRMRAARGYQGPSEDDPVSRHLIGETDPRFVRGYVHRTADSGLVTHKGDKGRIGRVVKVGAEYVATHAETGEAGRGRTLVDALTALVEAHNRYVAERRAKG